MNRKDSEEKRLNWIECIRLLSILLVIITHYISKYNVKIGRYWHNGEWTSIILKGISGKLGVAMFCVLTGFFAVESVQKKGLGKFIERRYVNFVTRLFAINVICAVIVYIANVYKLDSLISYNDTVPQMKGIIPFLYLQQPYTFKAVVYESLLMKDGILPVLWCMKDLFLGGILAALMADRKYVLSLYIIIILLCFILGFTWIGICLLGSLINIINSKISINKLFQKKYVKLFCLLIVYVLVHHEETEWGDIANGAACALFFLVSLNSHKIQGFLERLKIGSIFSRKSFDLYLVHVPVQTVFSFYLLRSLSVKMEWGGVFWVSLFITLLVDIAAAELFHRLIGGGSWVVRELGHYYRQSHFHIKEKSNDIF